MRLAFWKKKPEPPTPPKPPRRALCGNRSHELLPVRLLGGGYEACCDRCVGVVKDRTRNMDAGPVLLTGARVIWRDDDEDVTN